MKLFSTRNINTIIAAAAVLILMIFLFSYSETGTPPAFNSDNYTKQNPNFFLVNSRGLQFDENGERDIAISSERMVHNPEDDSINIREPRFTFFKDGEISWKVRAQSGVIDQGRDQLELQQRVEMVSSDGRSSLTTPQLFIFPNTKKAKTAKPVTLTNSNGFTRAIGMNADLQKKHIALLSQVRGQYTPPAEPEHE